MSQIKTCFHWSMIQLWINLFPSWRPHVITQLKNIKGTKDFYIIKTCEQILYFNSISPTFSFNTTAEGGDWGWDTTPKKSVHIQPAISFLPCQILTKLCDFHYPISRLIQSSIPNFKPCRSCPLLSKHDECSYPRKCFWVVCYSKCTP